MSTRLAVFFTRGVSMRDWADAGLLEREVALYRVLSERGVRVSFVTYGGRDDRDLEAGLDGMRILPIGAARTPRRDAVRMLARQGARVAACNVYRTNQIPGAGLALLARRLFRRRLIVRCGYLHSLDVQAQGQPPGAVAAARDLERRAFRAADAAVVTTASAAEHVRTTYQVPPRRVRVVPNYVTTDRFRPMPEVPRVHDLVFVGRASPEKNLGALLEALKLLRDRGRAVSLLLIGAFEHDPAMRAEARASGLPVTFAGTVDNPALPRHLNSARAFILPSLYEGHPKALIEAMACGLPCIGTRVRGIAEVLGHDTTGYLTDPTPEPLARAIDVVLSDAALRERLGAAARADALANYALERIAGMELQLLDELR